MTIHVAVFGAAGRMGEALLRHHNAVQGVKVVAGVLKPLDPLVGADASRIFGGPEIGIPLVGGLEALVAGSDAQMPKIDVIVDFSRPELTIELARWCVQHSVALVSGTTGLSQSQRDQLQVFAQSIVIIQSNNMSPGVNVCFELVADLAKRLGDTVDVEIVEAHHKHKIDAPSGTALRLGEVIAQAWGTDLQSRAVYSRDGRTGARVNGTIGFATIRAADIVGDHRVIFAAEGESIEIVHRSTSRAHYAKGSYLAAKWIADQQAGLYSMVDVLR